MMAEPEQEDGNYVEGSVMALVTPRGQKSFTPRTRKHFGLLKNIDMITQLVLKTHGTTEAQWSEVCEDAEDENAEMQQAIQAFTQTVERLTA